MDDQDGIRRPGRDAGRAARGERARRDRQRDRDAEHHRVRRTAPACTVKGTVLGQLAASDAVLTRGREGTGRRAARHRRRHDRPRDLRARQPLAHGRDPGRRRPLHQRHRRRPPDADPRGREAEAAQRLRAVRHGRGRGDDRGRERRRPPAARDGAPDPDRRAAAARRGDLPPRVGRDPARRLREVAELGDRAHRRRRNPRRAARDRRADLRPADPARLPGRRRRRAGGPREQSRRSRRRSDWRSGRTRSGCARRRPAAAARSSRTMAGSATCSASSSPWREAARCEPISSSTGG